MSRPPRRTSGGSRARLLAGAGALAVVAALLPALDRAVGPDGSTAALPLLTATDASWTDSEHVTSPLVRGARDCTRAYRYSSTSSSRMLSGALLGTDLDPLAALSGVRTTHTGEVGTSASPQPATAPAAAPDAHAAPLSVTALSSTLGAQTASVVALPAAGQEAAVLQQHARATSDGEAAAATGAVGSTGAVRTTTGAGSVPDGRLPSPAVLDLAALAPGTAALAGARLEVGALASTALLDGCLRDELGALPLRDYGVSGLRTVLTTPTVPAVTQTAKTAAAAAQASVESLERTLESALGGVGSLLGSTVTVDVQVDAAAAVAPLLTERLGDGTEVVVDLGRGTVEVDLARLLSGGVNGRAPGTELVLDQAALSLVTTRVDALLTGWVTSVESDLEKALRAAPVTARARLGGLTLLDISGTVDGITRGSAKVNALGGVVKLGDVLGVMGPLLDTGLFGPTGVVKTLGRTVRGATPPVTAATSTSLSGLRSAVSLVVNDQRQPAPGVYDVAALRVRVLPGTGSPVTDLRLATSSVGPVVERP